MNMNRLFSFPRHLIDELNSRVARGHRSKYVSEALEDKLFPKTEYTLVKDASGKQLLHALVYRDDVSDFLKRCIKSELGIEG